MESFGKLNVATNSVKEYINQCFDKKEPWQIVAITAGSVLTSVWVWDVIFQDESKFIISLYFLFNCNYKFSI